MFWVKIGLVCRLRGSHCWELILSNVSFCSLFAGNYEKTWCCLKFFNREPQVLLLDKFNFIHSWAHTRQRTVFFSFGKIFYLKNYSCSFSIVSENAKLCYLDLHCIYFVPRVILQFKNVKNDPGNKVCISLFLIQEKICS